MPYLYILKNNRGKHYIGITSIDPRQRLERHNKGDVISTKSGRPWQIIYLDNFKNLILARQKEKIIKSWHGGNALRRFLAKAAGSSNGRTPPFEGGYLGSNPSPAALAGKNKFGGVK